MALDNVASAVLSVPKRAEVLVVSSGNDALRFALTTDEARMAANVDFAPATDFAPELLVRHGQLAGRPLRRGEVKDIEFGWGGVDYLYEIESYDAEYERVRAWVPQRVAWVDANIDGW